jgi:hypothetical protein
VRLVGPLPPQFSIQTNIPRNVKIRIFIRDNSSGQIISEIRSSLVEEAQPFEAYRMYDPLPFMGVSFKSTLPIDCELEI